MGLGICLCNVNKTWGDRLLAGFDFALERELVYPRLIQLAQPACQSLWATLPIELSMFHYQSASQMRKSRTADANQAIEMSAGLGRSFLKMEDPRL